MDRNIVMNKQKHKLKPKKIQRVLKFNFFLKRKEKNVRPPSGGKLKRPYSHFTRKKNTPDTLPTATQLSTARLYHP